VPKAYVISEVEVVNEDLAAKYREIAASSITEFGGRYLVRGAEADVVEGRSTMRRIVIVEFPSMERARAWYASASYAPALRLRHAALDRRLAFADGVDDPFAE
jgi:uncharacterized protein (DUF1330 family)